MRFVQKLGAFQKSFRSSLACWGPGPSGLPLTGVQLSVMQCSAVQCRSGQCYSLQCSALQCSALHCTVVQYSAVHCSTGQCSADLASATHYSAVQCGPSQQHQDGDVLAIYANIPTTDHLEGSAHVIAMTNLVNFERNTLQLMMRSATFELDEGLFGHQKNF